MRLSVVMVLAALGSVACGATSGVLAGPSPTQTLITPTPWPSPTATADVCLNLPPVKCDVMRRVEDDQKQALDRWRAEVARTYDPLPAIPFVASTPRPTPGPATPTPEPAVRSCTASDLVAVENGTNGAGGVTMRAVVFANRSDSPCGLKGRFGVRIFVNGRPADASYADPDATSGHLVILGAGQDVPVAGAAVRPGQAWTWVMFSRSCSYLSASASEVAFALRDGSIVRVALPARDLGGPTRTPIPTERCTDAPYFPYVGASDIAPVLPVEMPAESSPMLTVALRSPGLAVAGEMYRFEVTLTNASSEPFHFIECPNYAMSVSGGAEDRVVRERHALRCDTLPPLASHATAVFAMEIAIPGDWPVTLDGGLGWNLEGYAAGVKLSLGIARRA
jgi:hypothetical protein